MAPRRSSEAAQIQTLVVMKLRAEIKGKTSTIDIKYDGARASAEIDGRRYDVEAHASHPGAILLLNDGHVYQCRVDRLEGSLGSFEVTVNNYTYAVVLTDPKRLRGSSGSSTHSDATAQIVAPMPGKVVRVLVETGAEVEAGAGIVVVEAMKMQNELKSPKAGKIAAINVVAGATINAGDVLAIVE